MVDELVLGKVVGQHAPLAAGLEEVEDGVHDLTGINVAGTASGFGRRNERGDEPPLTIRKIAQVGLACGILNVHMGRTNGLYPYHDSEWTF